MQSLANRDYDDDKVISEIVQPCIEELRRSKMERAPVPESEKPPEVPDDDDAEQNGLPNGYQPRTAGNEDNLETSF